MTANIGPPTLPLAAWRRTLRQGRLRHLGEWMCCRNCTFTIAQRKGEAALPQPLWLAGRPRPTHPLIINPMPSQPMPIHLQSMSSDLFSQLLYLYSTSNTYCSAGCAVENRCSHCCVPCHPSQHPSSFLCRFWTTSESCNACSKRKIQIQERHTTGAGRVPSRNVPNSRKQTRCSGRRDKRNFDEAINRCRGI